MHPLLTHQVLIYTHVVTWGEMDAFAHVNNTQYFRYFEHARMRHFEQLGIIDYMQQHHIGPILGETRCRFRIPLTYPDTVQIGVRVEAIGEDRFTHVYTVVSEQHNAIAAEGEGRVIFYDYIRQTKAPLPASVRGRL